MVGPYIRCCNNVISSWFTVAVLASLLAVLFIYSVAVTIFIIRRYLYIAYHINGLWLLCLTPLSTIFQLWWWWSVLLVEESWATEPFASHWQTLSHNETLSRNVCSSKAWYNSVIFTICHRLSHTEIKPTTFIVVIKKYIY